jgi:hypothetical protein
MQFKQNFKQYTIHKKFHEIQKIKRKVQLLINNKISKLSKNNIQLTVKREKSYINIFEN